VRSVEDIGEETPVPFGHERPVMPKSNATSLPSGSIRNRLPGECQRENAVAQRVAQEGLDHGAARDTRSKPSGASAARSLRRVSVDHIRA